ncbi:hypothetical protein BLS_006594 [Venturia inaequalis]|uniref:Uncharacterized protein n=1 Tax=Venturia inaequalis TaxID=5025 RepID=A0A8H3V6P8_VENIN|nr:hypothetical protein EG328_003278 [Venturia inaequalis]KAE9982057.1 hypothetical protein BLS_006594 [Venturia inaequalis]
MPNPGPPKNFRVSFKSSSSNFERTGRDEEHPLSSLHFQPAWDSDDLFDALRTAYPQIRRHKDRCVRAGFEFYDAELRRVKCLGEGPITPPSSPPDTARSDEFVHQGERGSSSKDAEMPVWQSSASYGAGANTHKPQKRKRSGMEEMQATFSIVPGGGKPRTKRPMTAAERDQYRHTKKVGACDPCRKRKRKCVCKLATEAHISDGKRPRQSDNCIPVKEIFSASKEPTIPTEHKETGFDHHTQLPVFDASDIQQSLRIEEMPEDAAVSRVSRSLSLSPLIRAFDANFDLSSFLLCPELNLGDLAMPGNPMLSLDLQEEHLPSASIPVPESPTSFETPLKFASEYLDCEAFVNFREPAPVLDTSTKHGVVHLQNHVSPGCASIVFTNSLQLISRAATALAPYSRFAADAQLLLGDLSTLKIQLELLQKPLPFLSKSSRYHNTARDIVTDINEPLQEFLTRLEQLCGVDETDGQRLKLAYMSTSFQIQKSYWFQGVKDDAKRLRGLIGSRSSTIGCLMTLISMETLKEAHSLLNFAQTSGHSFTMGFGTLDGFD